MIAATLARVAIRLTATTALAGLLAAVPWALVTFVGWPLPRQLPTSLEDLRRLLTMPVTDEVVIGLLAVAAWVLWATFVISLTAEAAARLRGVGAPRLPGLHPMQTLAGWLLSGVTAGMLATSPLTTTGAGDVAPPPAVTIQATTPPSAAVAAPVPAVAPVVSTGHITLLVAGRPHQCTVARGDTLWDIAEAWLGDPTRWPEIWQLNQHRTWPQVSGPVRFTDPDLIYPNWVLILPDDATPPAPPDPEPEREPEPVDRLPVRPGVDDAPPAPDGLEETPTPEGAPSPAPGSRASSEPPAASLDPDGVVPPPPGATPTVVPPVESRPTTPPPAYPQAVGSPDTGAEADQQPSGEDHAEQPAPADGDPDGVSMPDGSWLPWAVAAAIASAMAVVWLQRRRRYIPHNLADTDATDTDTGREPVAEEPPVVGHIRRAVRAHTSDAEGGSGDQAEQAAGGEVEVDLTPTGRRDPVPAAANPPPVGGPVAPGVEPLPAGGVGLGGPGAEAAARGALIAALAAGQPTDPDAHTEVVVPADTLVTLLGADAVRLRGWPRLHITDNLDAALTHVEARLLATARLLDEYEVTNLEALYRAAPGERPVPPLLLIAATPAAGMRMRTRMALGLGHDQRISGLLLGGWGHGTTLHVEPEGTCHRVGDHTGQPGDITDRLPVLSTEAASTLLQTLREAHTGQPPPEPASTTSGELHAAIADAGSAQPAGAPAVPADDEKTPAASPDAHDGQPPAGPAPPAATTGRTADSTSGEQGAPRLPKAVVRVLGTPQILNAEQTGRQLRATATELLVYLAAHRDGATPEKIEEDLWPEARRRQAAPRLHTTASNLRLILAAAAGAAPVQAEHYLRKHRGRYQLGTVEVDLWQLHDAWTQAQKTTDPQQRLATLRRACTIYTGDLAHGHDYGWITSHRERARDLALDAHRSLAAILGQQDPAEAAQLLTQAVRIDPMAEHLYQQAMRAHHRLGDPDTIRDLLRQLARNLDTVGGEPSEETMKLADTLRRDLNRPASER
jgi:DNA-binding SARP family transcriptional activator